MYLLSAESTVFIKCFDRAKSTDTYKKMNKHSLLLAVIVQI